MSAFLRVVLAAFFVAVMGPVAVSCDGGGDGKKDEADTVNGDTIECVPDCDGKTCGTDGCGGSCGTCADGYDCTGAGQCQVVETCAIEHAIVCGGKVSGTTDDYQNGIDYYACQGYLGGGPEVGYAFKATSDDHIVVTLDTPVSGLDLVVTEGKCDPDSCVAYGKQEVEVDVASGKTVFLMVEGQEGVTGPFTLSVACHSSCTPDCEGKECGNDGCGGSCGECPVAAPYCAQGLCAMECTPDCAGLACGENGCGGSCGTCPAGWGCEEGTCEPTPEGPDGCDALTGPGCQDCFCQACVCSILPECCAIEWNAKCANLCHSGDCNACPGEGSFGWACESDDECYSGLCVEGLAGSKVCSSFCVDDCPNDWSCVFNPEIYDTKFCSTECYPDCTGKECGSDGCGGSCGECQGDHTCFDGTCQEGSVVVGACTNENDMNIIMTDAAELYDQSMFCAMTCEMDGDCAAGCVSEQYGLGSECAGCFGDLGTCAATNCFELCMGGFQNSDCAKCASDNGCMQPFGACTGFE